MRHYLGRSTKDDFRDGCMQDVHWFAGLFGYFPSYTMGAVIAAQLFAAVRRDQPDAVKALSQRRFRASIDLVAQERARPWQAGHNRSVAVDATGSPLGPDAFKAHLRARYIRRVNASLAEFVVQHPDLLVLTGAGLSTASGIGDYRGEDGAWKRRPPVELRDFLRSDHARRRYWSRSLFGWPHFAAAEPNAGHRALARLHRAGRLDRHRYAERRRAACARRPRRCDRIARTPGGRGLPAMRPTVFAGRRATVVDRRRIHRSQRASSSCAPTATPNSPRPISNASWCRTVRPAQVC